MTTATTPSTKPASTRSNNKKKWTNTNSDELCLQNVNNPISRALYVLSLKTGLYAVEKPDQRISLVIVGFLTMVSSIMFYVFVQGVRDGFQQAMNS